MMTQTVSYLKQQHYLASVSSVLQREEERVSERALALRGQGPMDEPDFGRLPSSMWGKQVRENELRGQPARATLLGLGDLKAAWGLILHWAKCALA